MYGTLIASSTVGAGGASSISFSAIPSTYTDLYLIFSCRTSIAAAADDLYLTINGSSTTFTRIYLRGNGATSTSVSGTNNAVGMHEGNSPTASTFDNGIITIPNYAGSTNKSFSIDVVTENNAATGYQFMMAGLWSTTSAITSLTISGNNAYLQNSTAYLYGLLKGSGGATAA